MKLLGFEVRNPIRRAKALSPPMYGNGTWVRIDDPFTGAWQQDASIELDTVLTFSAVFACIRLISSDISKMALRLMERRDTGIWKEAGETQFAAVLKKPNGYQTRIKFIAMWIISKLIHGNTYVLKGRDRNGVVRALWILDPTRVQTLISDSGEVFYRLQTDKLAQVGDAVLVPATEIIHDVYLTPEHPLVGVSPIGACGLAALQGKRIQTSSEAFFKNRSVPSGIILVPGSLTNEKMREAKARWQENYSGENAGKTAILTDGMTYQQLTITPVDAQLVEQLKLTAEDVCRAFGVPPYKVGVGAMPAYNNINALDQAYYSQTLQEPIENIELLLDEGLELPTGLRTEFDLDDLLRMDIMTQTQVLKEQVQGGLLSPDEGRAKIGYEPVPGGRFPYLQQQNFSLAALRDRDIKLQGQQEGPVDGQVATLQALLSAAAAGQIPPESVRAAIKASFPLLTDAQVDAMIAPLLVVPDDEPDPAPTEPDEPSGEMALDLLYLRAPETLSHA